VGLRLIYYHQRSADLMFGFSFYLIFKERQKCIPKVILGLHNFGNKLYHSHIGVNYVTRFKNHVIFFSHGISSLHVFRNN